MALLRYALLALFVLCVKYQTVAENTLIERYIKPRNLLTGGTSVASNRRSEAVRNGGGVTKNARPNIVLMIADDLGYGDLSMSGHPTSRTPTLDAVASQSKFLTQFYVTSPVCSPSRASLLTGRYQTRSGAYPGTFVPESTLGLPLNETTIAEVLKTSGYRTSMVGKWHLGVGEEGQYLPAHQGFDDYLGIPYSHDMCPCLVCHQANRSCEDTCWPNRVSCPLFSNVTIVEQPAYMPTITEKLLDRAEKFVQSSVSQKEPFFLYMAFYQVHHPQFSSATYENTSSRGLIGDSLAELDGAVAQMMRLLKDQGIDNNTIVWFLSDNGPSLVRHERGGCAGQLRCGKGTTWEGGVRVPAFIRWPGKIQPGRSDELLTSLDVLPTLASIAKADINHLQLDGLDASVHLLQPGVKTPREFFAVYGEIPNPIVGPLAVMYDTYKAHYYTKGSSLSDMANYDPMCRVDHHLTKHDPPLLFDLSVDPGERWNVSNETKSLKIIERMSAWRELHMSTMTWMPPQTSTYKQRAQPCCNGNTCDPFPSCCDCKNDANYV